jgi:hypothetical protein
MELHVDVLRLLIRQIAPILIVDEVEGSYEKC